MRFIHKAKLIIFKVKDFPEPLLLVKGFVFNF